jgi:hypothetical protein
MLYDSGEFRTFRSPSYVTFWVPAGVDHFDVDLRGGGGREGLSAVVYRPDGGGFTEVASDSTTETINSFSLSVNVSPGDTDLMWMLEIAEPADNPSDPMLEDVHISFSAEIGPYYGLTDDGRYFLVGPP